MPYVYAECKQHIFSQDMQPMFLSIRDTVKVKLEVAGCFTMGSIISTQTGDTWHMMACVDRLVEIGELVEVAQVVPRPGQHRIFRRPDWRQA